MGSYKYEIRKLIAKALKGMLYIVLRVVPLQDKIIASSFHGYHYDDNPKSIVERVHKIYPKADIVWAKAPRANYTVPEYVRTISTASRIKRIIEYATAKVWISSDCLALNLKKRKGQLFIETWHGGLGIKKIEMDVERFRNDKKKVDSTEETSKAADVFISNSDFLSSVYRSAFRYKGIISKCGSPRNDILIKDNSEERERIRSFYNIPRSNMIAVYAPTFRETSNTLLYKENDTSMYEIEFDTLKKVLEDKYDNEWTILVRMHPNQSEKNIKNIIKNYDVINATNYHSMQDIIMAADLFISDYSSCIFDAAAREIPCFTFATDFEQYKADRGVYYEMEELPFPYAKNNAVLIDNIRETDMEDYLEKWHRFVDETGLIIDGNATDFIANNIKRFMTGYDISWEYKPVKSENDGNRKTIVGGNQ